MSDSSVGQHVTEFDYRQGQVVSLFIWYRPSFGSTLPPMQWVLGSLSCGVRWLEHEADNSPSSSEEVKNGGAILSFLRAF
jgi:hypothetical protein